MTAAQRNIPAPFLSKTYKLVDDYKTNDVVSWNEDGTGFVVWKTDEFAKDLLPQYFKHNNFSSFIRQLNTYGFRKTVPEKWEFGNDNFRRGQENLLSTIRRRKPEKFIVIGSLLESNSESENHGSSSTSSPGSKNSVADLTGENKKLKRENNNLSSELAAAKKQRDDLVMFLSEKLKVEPEQIDEMMKGRRLKPNGSEKSGGEGCSGGGEEPEGEEFGGNMKLFGVYLKGERKKRGREENNKNFVDFKNVDFQAPLWKTSKVCN